MSASDSAIITQASASPPAAIGVTSSMAVTYCWSGHLCPRQRAAKTVNMVHSQFPSTRTRETMKGVLELENPELVPPNDTEFYKTCMIRTLAGRKRIVPKPKSSVSKRGRKGGRAEGQRFCGRGEQKGNNRAGNIKTIARKSY